MKTLLVISMLVLVGCGKPGSGSGTTSPVVVTPVIGGLNYTLQAGITEPGDHQTDASTAVSGTMTIPSQASVILNATDSGYATLTFSAGQCYYKNVAGSNTYNLFMCTNGFVAGQQTVTTGLYFSLATGYYSQDASVSITVLVK